MEAVRRAIEDKYECLLFDIDDTLYPLSIGVNLACRKNIEEFMLQYLDIEENEVPGMCLELYREYGATVAGLKALGYEFDNDEFHAYVHGRLPYEIVRPDSVLRNLLLSMPQRKIIFTNADMAHARQVLKRLGLDDCFEGIICFETLNPPLEPASFIDALDENQVLADQEPNSADITDASRDSSKQPILCKPSLEAFKAAIRIADVNLKKTIFFDDSARNIATGKAAGLHTVTVGSSVLLPGADYALRSIHNIKEAILEIWDGAEKDMEQVIQSAAIENLVLA